MKPDELIDAVADLMADDADGQVGKLGVRVIGDEGGSIAFLIAVPDDFGGPQEVRALDGAVLMVGDQSILDVEDDYTNAAIQEFIAKLVGRLLSRHLDKPQNPKVIALNESLSPEDVKGMLRPDS